MNIRRASALAARAAHAIGVEKLDKRFCGSRALARFVRAANRVERAVVAPALIAEALEERDETARAERAEIAALRAAWCPARPYTSDAWSAWCDADYRASCEAYNADLPTGDVYDPSAVTEADRADLVSEYWDLYKCKHNIRPRWFDFDALALEDLVVMLNALHREPYTL